MAVNSGAQQMVKLLGEDARGLVFTQVVRSHGGARPNIVRDYRNALKKVAAPETEFQFAGGLYPTPALTLALQRLKPSRDTRIAGHRAGRFA